MKRKLHLLAGAVLLTATAQFSGCSSDDDFLMMEPIDPQTRATVLSDDSITITFEDFDSSMMAMPTSYGDNYYGTVGGYTKVTRIGDDGGFFTSEINTINGVQAFYNGGIALSKWNYYCNPTDTTVISKPSGELSPDWWYSYYNQMSVYNKKSTSGGNCSAGHSGNNFGVVYGYQDDYNQSYMDKASFSFNEEYTLKGLWYCNSSYTYGVMLYGNTFGNIGEATSLVSSNGYFEVILECYDVDDQLVGTDSLLLADYREGNTCVVPVTTWTYWPIGISGVKTVKFNFTGSDTGDYGLNTPAYICIDDITIVL